MIARRYLDGRERAIYQAATPLRQQSLLIGRVALKDAVRAWLGEHGHKPLFPIEIEIHADSNGRPRVRGPWAVSLHVSLAHKDGIAVAMCTDTCAAGIDIEKIESRGDEFVRLALTESEQALLPAADRDAWVTRIWTAKEAIAKADGTGLRGSPRSFVVSLIAGDRLIGAVTALWRRRVLPPGPAALPSCHYVRVRRLGSHLWVSPPAGRPEDQPPLFLAAGPEDPVRPQSPLNVRLPRPRAAPGFTVWAVF
jgi:phosphopantetheinyl transferase (holo-ACP synthase)